MKSYDSELQYHIKMRKGDVGKYVLLPGDPGRVELIASFLDNASLVIENREHKTYTGSLEGVAVSVTSTGIGSPSTAIAVEELSQIGADTFIRVGTSGVIQEHVKPGDLIVVSGAVRDEGTSLQYMPLDFPAIADLDLVHCLTEACNKTNANYHVGLSHSKDSFYGEVEPNRMPISTTLNAKWDAWQKAGVLCSEMEASALFIVSSILQNRAGGLMIAGGTHESLDVLCKTAVEGIRLLIALDANQQ
ncbi:MAG TPA: uridine phosphorylase [Chloroflexi bacterium]|nr:uridine phosphorylase [Chloroflexota bacterium]HCU98807.1 uridine phosphorylase [Chloroflexota bacterium]|tara:strand:+ start:1839 stop:2579 length:741 start_codon:yes stop_codon:yes gene_type:complete